MITLITIKFYLNHHERNWPVTSEHILFKEIQTVHPQMAVYLPN